MMMMMMMMMMMITQNVPRCPSFWGTLSPQTLSGELCPLHTRWVHSPQTSASPPPARTPSWIRLCIRLQTQNPRNNAVRPAGEIRFFFLLL